MALLDEKIFLPPYGNAPTDVALEVYVRLSSANFGVIMSAVAKTPKICWICGRVVYLEESKVDRSGLPVHESCYVMKMKLANLQEPIRKRPRP